MQVGQNLVSQPSGYQRVDCHPSMMLYPVEPLLIAPPALRGLLKVPLTPQNRKNLFGSTWGQCNDMGVQSEH